MLRFEHCFLAERCVKKETRYFFQDFDYMKVETIKRLVSKHVFCSISTMNFWYFSLDNTRSFHILIGWNDNPSVIEMLMMINGRPQIVMQVRKQWKLGYPQMFLSKAGVSLEGMGQLRC